MIIISSSPSNRKNEIFSNSPIISSPAQETLQRKTLLIFLRSIQNCFDLDDRDSEITLKQLIENFTHEDFGLMCHCSRNKQTMFRELIFMINQYLDEKPHFLSKKREIVEMIDHALLNI